MDLSRMPVVIMAGGLGTRIREKVKDLPKPMIEFAGKPFLYYKIIQLKQAGFREIILTIGYLGEKIQEYFKDGRALDLHIQYSVEKEPLGTGGGLKQVAPLISTPFLMLNADTYYELNWQEMLDEYGRMGATHMMMLTDPINPGQEGTVKQDAEGNIVEFEEKSPLYTGKRINGGVYILDPSIFAMLPLGKSSIEKDVFPRLARLRLLKGYYYKGYFIDIGTPRFYDQFQRDIARGRIRL
jgi:NDP-sugar pyrophosphorylase family protein